MVNGSDGRAEAEAAIRKAGGKVVRGLIEYKGSDPDAMAAVTFLIWEWDYAAVD